MKNLREVGEGVIQSITKKKPSHIGDLVLGISDIIRELQHQQNPHKLSHLEGLFEELISDQPYELKDVLDSSKDLDTPPPYLSSPTSPVINWNTTNSHVSGAINFYVKTR